MYVKFQPYRQSTIVNRKCLKLSVKFFGPYCMLEKIGVVAYKLELPVESQIHPVFHVSQLKQHKGPIDRYFPLPLLTDDGLLAKEPLSILDRRMVKKQGHVVIEVLVHRKNSFPEDSTWKIFSYLMGRYPAFHL